MTLTIQQCFDLLGIGSDATMETADKAYHDLCTVWDPSKYENNPDLKRKAEDKNRQIQEAYRRIRAYIQAKQNPCTTSNAPLAAAQPTSSSEDPEIEKWSRVFEVQKDMEVMRSTLDRKLTRKRFGIFKMLLLLSILSSIGSLYFFTPMIRQVGEQFFQQIPGISQIPGIGTHLAKSEKTSSGTPSKLENKLTDIQKAIANGELAKQIGNNDPALQTQSEGEDAPDRKPGVKGRIEIHMDNGRIIYTSGYRIEDDIIRYRTAGGEMGIPKNRVQAIRSHSQQ